MIPITLTLSGFLSYREEVTLNFEQIDLACIAGPNGAGKSSLLDALTYALFGKARRSDEALINLQSDAAFVELVFAYESNVYRVQRTNPRGKSTLLEFQIQVPAENGSDEAAWKALTERTVRATQQRIEETLRLDYDTFVNAAFFLQGRADQFSQQTPSRRKAILGSILGLDIWESYRLESAARRKKVEAELQALDGRLAEIQVELAEESERKKLLKSLNKELERVSKTRATQESVLESVRLLAAQIEAQEKHVEALAGQRDAARSRLIALEGRKAARQEEHDRYSNMLAHEKEVRQQYTELQELRAQLQSWDEASREYEKDRRAPVTEIEKARAVLQAELEQLRGQLSDLEAHREAAASLQARVSALEAERSEVREQLEGRAALEEELRQAREQQAAARAENPRLKTEMESLRKRIDQLKETREDAAVCPVCGQPLTSEQREELIEELTREGKMRGDQYRANRTLLQQAEEHVMALEKQIEAFRRLEEEDRRLEGDLLTVVNSLTQHTAVLEAWEKQGAPRLLEVEKMLAAEDFAHEARQALAEIDAALLATGYDAAEHDRIRKAVQDLAPLDDDMRTLEKAAAALEPLSRELEELNSEIQSAGAELQSAEERHQEAVASLAALQAESPDLEQTQRDLLDIVEQENELRMRLGSAQQKVDVLAGLKARKERLTEEREALSRRIAHHVQLERAFGKDGVPALLIEQAIPQIETTANELLERLSGGEMSIRFQTQRELKSREDLRETLDITISDRSGTRDYELYSGGEAFRVDFAIRLALSEILARRSGARLQTLVIDEGFGSQDEVGRQRLIEAINMVREDFAKVLVITHIDALKEAFPARIEVEKSASGSALRVLSA